MEINQIANHEFSHFGSKNVIKGDFLLNGIIKISSSLEGTLKMEDDGQITIEKLGSFIGDITCKDISIYGHFKGNIQASGKVVIQPASFVSGSIKADSLAIYPGSVVNIEGHTL